MSFKAFRRWIARHPLSWVLGLALALAGAQTAAAVHELTHVASAVSSHDDGHSAAGHECPMCLLAAALGGAAPAPTAVLLVEPHATATVAGCPEHRFFARTTRAYAPRAPPGDAPAAVAT